jgi:hypothetical protein
MANNAEEFNIMANPSLHIDEGGFDEEDEH